MNLILVHEMRLVGVQDLLVDPDVSLHLSEEENVFLEITEFWDATHDANAFAMFCFVLKLEFNTVLFADLVWNNCGVLQISIMSIIGGHVCLQWYLIVLVGQFLNLKDLVMLGVFISFYIGFFVNLDVVSWHCIFHLHPLGMDFSGWGSGLHSYFIGISSSMSNR